ncbi:hypothetical protein AQUCO_03800113v1 [Aquilegia coerulea]|uniref:Uncharacterized protein n=1 Tax=Aquilegia coerulea TaxID=218851 RepID=A0A2G5CSL6_AQUCA|nr:hypothetical protein AQUCO_03800113v1 [Aquilegia coerulea]
MYERTDSKWYNKPNSQVKRQDQMAAKDYPQQLALLMSCYSGSNNCIWKLTLGIVGLGGMKLQMKPCAIRP